MGRRAVATLDRRIERLAHLASFAEERRDIGRAVELRMHMGLLVNERARLAEWPILMNTRMARATAARLKTQDRRPVELLAFDRSTTRGYEWTYRDRKMHWRDVDNVQLRALCPHGNEGDRLWVRETWGLSARSGDPTEWHKGSVRGYDARALDNWMLQYAADWGPCQEACYWRPNIHMPRWACRIVLDLIEVRVEPLQSISEADARAEGLVEGVDFARFAGDQLRTARDAYALLWNQLYAPELTWASNPFVWVLSFKRPKT